MWKTVGHILSLGLECSALLMSAVMIMEEEDFFYIMDIFPVHPAPHSEVTTYPSIFEL